MSSPSLESSFGDKKVFAFVYVQFNTSWCPIFLSLHFSFPTKGIHSAVAPRVHEVPNLFVCLFGTKSTLQPMSLVDFPKKITLATYNKLLHIAPLSFLAWTASQLIFFRFCVHCLLCAPLQMADSKKDAPVLTEMQREGGVQDRK